MRDSRRHTDERQIDQINWRGAGNLDRVRTRLPKLVVVAGDDTGLVFGLVSMPAIVGRAVDADVSVEGVGVSRMHAQIERDESGGFAVLDLGSANGTFVNGVRVQRAGLVAGDHIRIGREVILEFTIDVLPDDRETIDVDLPIASMS